MEEPCDADNDDPIDTQTITETVEAEIKTELSTQEQWYSLDPVTSAYTTVVVQNAFCHYQNQPQPPQVDTPPPVPQGGMPHGCDDCRPWYHDGGWGWTHGQGGVCLSISLSPSQPTIWLSLYLALLSPMCCSGY